MKKVLMLIMILYMASMAKAALKISVNGAIDPLGPINLTPSQTAKIGIWGDGLTPPYIDLYLINEPMDKATMSGGDLLYPGHFAEIHLFNGVTEPHISILRDLGYNTVQSYYMNFVDVSVPPLAPLSGTLVDSITIHCDDDGDVRLTLMNLTWITIGYDENDDPIYMPQITVYDTQIIHQTSVIPEPMTTVLLGLGGLFLRRNK